ncbi:uncharacterized protein LOC127583668 [Pristis pectinata]|uniref:uncharacterized protein LOC127583668 n=1 Tax=Pristis pectinata TaxID=685728 RepID=UPI00223D7E3D|nr:uncharacterized protein LOC127583668 [Pristis pectinata]XP_051895852.1 uncharacterized protein LOC127583668 [Pristis pectinata]
MIPEIWDSDGGSTSDSSDLPNIVSSDEELKLWFPPYKAPQLSYEVLIPKRWCYLRTSVLKRYCHIIKVQLLSPILFGRPYTDELCRNWAVQAELIQHEDYGELQDFDLKTLKIIDLLESAHRALLVYALKRPLLIQFVRVVNESLVQCSTLEEAISVVKQQMIFRDAWEMTVGNKKQVATVLALTGLHYFNLIKQYSIDQNNLFEHFEDQCFQEEQQAKIFHELWEADLKKQHYEPAVKSLNEAIKVCAFNHLLYEKRSYCYLQLCQYKKAWSDAKRCIVLKPHSIEGHYLFAGAQCGKGWYARALKANSLAIQACQRKALNVKGLTEQRELIQTEQLLSTKEKQIGKWKSDNTSLKESSDSESSAVEEDDEEGDDESSEDEVIPSVEVVDVWLEKTNDNVQAEQEQNDQSLHFDIPFLSMNFKASSSDSENDSFDRLNQGHGSKMLSGGGTSDSESDSSLKEEQRDFAVPHNSVESDNQEKGLPAAETKTPPFPCTDSGKNASAPSTDTGTTSSSSPTDPGKNMNSLSVSSGAHQSLFESGLMLKEIEQVSSESKQHISYNTTEQREKHELEMTSKVEESLLKCKLKEASEALMASNFRNAQENYLHALNLIKEKKVYNLTTMEYILIEYACGLAFLGNNLIQDVLEAERHFKKIIDEFRDDDSSHFGCLSYYGLSRVHLKWNRYKEARSSIEKSLKLVENNLVPGLQTWPGTDTAIEETRDGVLKHLLNSLLKECLCPPRPDAVCHYRFCCTHNSKRDIYRSDPDFKGFVRVHCSYDCHIEYHLYCWKRCKIKEFQDKIEKDILGLDCLTPDCMGYILKFDIFQDSRQKTIESSKSKESKSSRNTATKQSGNIFSLKKIARKKEKKHQNPVKVSSNIHQDQIDTPNKKSDQSELKDETFGARRKEGRNKKNIGPSNEWIKNDKSGYLEEATVKVHESSYMDSRMADYYQWSAKEEKMENLFANTYIDDDLQDQHSSLNNAKTCDAATLTDPIKPFESKEKTFMILYHDKAQLLKSYEKSQNLYDQLCSATQDEIKTFKEKHEQLLFIEKKLRDELTTVKAQLGSVKEKLHDKREYQSQELGTLQEELKSVKNNLERNKKTIHEIDGEVKKIKGRREKQTSDKKKLQKMCGTTKGNCKESATRLLSVQSQIQEWKKYTKLYFLNRLHQEAVENVKFYTAQKARNANSPEVIASQDMWEKRMKGIQGQITLINAASWPQETGEYTDAVPYTDSSKLMPSQFRAVNNFTNHRRLSPSPTRIEMGKNVGLTGTSTSAEAVWFSQGSRTRGIDAETLPRTGKDAYIPSAWPPNYSNPPAMQPIPSTDRSRSDLELEFTMFTDQNKSFPDGSLQLAAGGLEMSTPSTEAKPVKIPDISLSGLRTSCVPGNLQNNLFEHYGAQMKSFNNHFNHLPSAQPIIHSNNDFQALQTQRPFGLASGNSSQTDEPRSSYHTVMEQLFFKFPTISKARLHSFINKVKEENGGTLSNLSVDELVRQVSYCVHQGTHPEMTYASPTDPLSFAPISYENLFFPSHHTLHSDQSRTLPDRFSGLVPVNADASAFESLPLGDLLELEGFFDQL